MTSAVVGYNVHNHPFPNCIIDRMVDIQTVRAIHAEWPTDGWSNHHHKHSEKRGCSEWSAFGPQTRSLILSLNEANFVSDIATAFGLRDVVADPMFFGGGLHETFTGGFLDIHADFNVHDETGLSRRLNLLLFLNEDWRDEWNGALELWDESRCYWRIEPEAGRCVIFATSDKSFHGHPQRLTCPLGISRRSIALYYYSPLMPGEQQRKHSTLYRGEEDTWFSEGSPAWLMEVA